MLATDGTWREEDDVADDWRAGITAALIASLALALAAGGFLLARRMTHALDTPLAPLPLVLTAGGLLAWAAATRLYLHDRRVDWMSAIVLALFAVGCSSPGNRPIDWLVWLTVFAVYGLLPARRTVSQIKADKSTEQFLQQLTRSRTADGSEVIHGMLLAEFAPGERTTTLHVAFCPPFERLPSVEVEVADGSAGDVKLAQVLHQGARLEARLSRASIGPQRVTIEILATDQQPPAA